MTKNNTWNGDTAAFWDTAHVKKQAGHLWFTVVNRTNGQCPDSMIYLAIGDNGTPWPLSSQNTIDMTNTGGGGRLYIMVGYKPNPSDRTTWRPANKVWDFEEHTIMGDGWYHGNTTRVDAFGTPIAYRIHCTDKFDTARGEQYYAFYQQRQSVFDEFTNEVPYEFTKLGTMQAPYRIPNPGASGSDVSTGGKYASYSDKYCQSFGITQTPYLNGISQPCRSAACYRHVMVQGGCDLPAGTPLPAQMTNEDNFYQTAPCCFYSYFLHRRALDNKCYGFPYDDVANGSSYVEHGNVSWLEIAVGW